MKINERDFYKQTDLILASEPFCNKKWFNNRDGNCEMASTSHSNYSRGGWGYASLTAVTGVSFIDFHFIIELLKANMHVRKMFTSTNH